MTKTENYDLNQWDAGDRVLREDFNADNAKIDTALKAITENAVQIAVGSYAGTGGSYYTGNTTQDITVGFAPKVVFITRGCYIADGIGAFITIENPLIYTDKDYVYGQLTDTGFTVGTAYVSGNTLYPDLNTVNYTYRYFAIG